MSKIQNTSIRKPECEGPVALVCMAEGPEYALFRGVLHQSLQPNESASFGRVASRYHSDMNPSLLVPSPVFNREEV